MEPRPSCPRSLRPQHRTERSPLITQLWSGPAAPDVTLPSVGMTVAVLEASPPSNPHWLWRLSPKHSMFVWPRVNLTMVWLAPSMSILTLPAVPITIARRRRHPARVQAIAQRPPDLIVFVTTPAEKDCCCNPRSRLRPQVWSAPANKELIAVTVRQLDGLSTLASCRSLHPAPAGDFHFYPNNTCADP